MKYTREKIASLIVKKLQQEKVNLKLQFDSSKIKIGYFYLDNLLPKELALTIYNSFPTIDETIQKKDLREFKYVAYQMDKYNTILEEIIYAIQQPKVVQTIQEICGLKSVLPDENLYAGGLSIMKKGGFLNPHLDNSHDKDVKNWRVLNLLYYVSPNWVELNGGNLELWPNGLDKKPLVITSNFNRLVVMATHNQSWHSVNKVKVDKLRYCISNYYFSNIPMLDDDTFHVTSFRGRPSQKVKNLILKLDSSIRMSIRKVFKKGIRENPHKYKK